MSNTSAAKSPAKENFADLLEESLRGRSSFEGSVVKGYVLSVDSDFVTVDVGLKSEGRIPLREFAGPGRAPEIKAGDFIDVFVERMEDKNGCAVLSVEKARREAAWGELEKASITGELVNGVIFGKVKGGFAVDLEGAVAFLPGSQVDVRPIRDITPLMNIAQPFKILKMDKLRSNIVVSRRAVLEDNRSEQRAELVSNLSEGQVLEGIVKNITDYGAFVDLGGVDGLLHVTDISWRRINHPSDMLKVGETVQVQVIRFNRDTQRISLGMKQLEADPWKGVEERYVPGSRHKGKITNIADYGAFVELEPAVEGLIYVTEMSWTKKNVHPSKILTQNQEVEVQVLEVDMTKRRISLGLKQCSENPWVRFAEKFPIGSILEGEIKNITEFGMFVGVDEEIDGMVHMTDVSWDNNDSSEFKKGDVIKVKVLDVDAEKERISLGIKQLNDDPYAAAAEGLKKGTVVTGTVTEVHDKGIEVALESGLTGSIKKADLSRERSEQRPDRFAVGEKVDAMVLSMDRSGRKANLSIKARELDEEKQAMSEFGSADSGASLGDILGEAMNKAKKTTKSKKAE
ncbi:MAG: 30S ribosomal protein S1 [Candidatus Paracaedibacteraceae bacterium]|jgi:small subunit ribosomal protein S1|nr:30S ribosomal protein S1 [Candidatus Paracaedibacteraceae bacterium]